MKDKRQMTNDKGWASPHSGWRATPKQSAHAPGSPPLACHWLSAHAPGSPPLAQSLASPLARAKQFCRSAPCAPQVKASASHKVKRFQKRCRGRSRGSESLGRSTPLSSPSPAPPLTRKVGDQSLPFHFPRAAPRASVEALSQALRHCSSFGRAQGASAKLLPRWAIG